MIVQLRDLFSKHVLRLVAQKIASPGTDEGVAFLEIHDENQVRETFQQPAAKLFLLRQLPLHPPPFGDVHQRPLVANDVSRCVPNRPRGIQKDRRLPILAAEFDLPRAHASAIVNRAPQHRLPGIEVQCRRFHCQKGALLGISQHAYQGRIGVEQLTVGRAEVDALLQGFEQFGEAHLLLAEFGYVAPQDARAYDLVAFDNTVDDAFKIKRPCIVLQPHSHRPGPALFFQKAPQAAFHFFLSRLLDQIVDLTRNQIGVSQPRQFGDALVHRPQSAVERHRACGVIKGVNQLLEVALRAHDDLAELVELLFRRRRAYVLLQSAQQTFEFADFAPASVGVYREQDRKKYDPNRNGSKLKRNVLQPLPQQPRQRERQQEHEPQSPAP